MAPSYECSASILLCAEDNNSVLGFDEDVGEAEVTSFQDLDGNRIQSRVFCANRSAFHGDFLDDFPLQSDECLALLVKREVDHLPMEGYSERLINGSLELSIRATAIDWIWKVGLAFPSSPLFSLFSYVISFFM
jgi:cyclin D1/2/4, plant